MTDKELRKLNKRELVQLLLQQSRELDNVREKLAAAEEQLNKIHMDIEDSGSIAEAALKISDIFTHAQEAADLYLRVVKERAGGMEPVPQEGAENDEA